MIAQHLERRRFALRTVWIAAVIAIFVSAAQAVTFEVTYADPAGEGFGDSVLGPIRRGAFQRAVDVWAGHLLDSGTIRIRASFAAMGGSAASVTLAEARPVFWNGQKAVSAYHDAGGTGNVPLYAPGVWQAGSSLSHLDEETFTGEMDLMTPYYDQPLREIDPVTLEILADMGWDVDENPLAAPEPGTVVLLLTGFAFAIIRRRHRST